MPDLQVMDILLLVVIITAAIGGGLYFLNRWAYSKMGEQQAVIDRASQVVTIYVIDKGRSKPQDANLPKVVIDNLPFYSKLMKMHLVKAKIGPQIMTLMCEKRVYNALTVKKNAKVVLAGIYIAEVKGMKSDEQMKAEKKAKKEAQKAAEKAAKSK